MDHSVYIDSGHGRIPLELTYHQKFVKEGSWEMIITLLESYVSARSWIIRYSKYYFAYDLPFLILVLEKERIF